MVYILSPEEIAKRKKEKEDFQNYDISGKSSIEIIKDKGESKIASMLKNHPFADENDVSDFLETEWKLSDDDKNRILSPKHNFSGLFSINDDKLTHGFNEWYKRNRSKKWYAETHKK